MPMPEGGPFVGYNKHLSMDSLGGHRGRKSKYGLASEVANEGACLFVVIHSIIRSFLEHVLCVSNITSYLYIYLFIY